MHLDPAATHQSRLVVTRPGARDRKLPSAILLQRFPSHFLGARLVLKLLDNRALIDLEVLVKTSRSLQQRRRHVSRPRITEETSLKWRYSGQGNLRSLARP